MKIILKNNKTYNEIHQVNPLRWKTLLRLPDGSFEDQSGWIKCKDFYNDTVAFFKTGSVFSIYGYKNDIKANDEGVYFLLKEIKEKESFLSNLAVVNERLQKDLSCEVSVLDHPDKDKLIILIPPALWESTYRISMITMVVRLCNYGYPYKTWEDIWASEAPAWQIDKAFDPRAIKNALTLGFHVPEKFQKYWFYAGEAYNSEVAPQTTGIIIHDNGVCGWSRWMAA